MTTTPSAAPAHTDARTFSRLLAAACLVLGPACFLVGAAVDPAWSDDNSEYLAEVAASPDRYQLAGLLSLVGGVLTAVGMVGVLHVLRGPRITVAQIGAGLVLIGSVAVAGTFPINVTEAVGAQTVDQATMVDLIEAVEDSGWAIAFFVTFIGGLVVGMLLLAIGLFFQRGAAPLWVPVLLIVSVVGSFFSMDQLLNVITSAGLVLALAGLAARIITVTDDDWARWTVLPDQGRRRRIAGARDAAEASS